jgi:rare lipoprotein A
VLCAAGSAGAISATAQQPAPTSGQTFFFTRPGELLGNTLRFRGRLTADQAGRTVQVQRQEADGSWTPTATAVVASDGSFLARWHTDQVGRFAVRAVLADAQAQAASTPLTTSVTVYRPVLATWFGPGFYGKRTACGQRMSHTLLGVAHRKLPCGTMVDLFYGGRMLTVPVVDRGPFANGARYDLTSAAAQALAMAQTSTIGVVAERAGLAAPAPAPIAGAGTGGVGPSP